jgi:hypothetical protein
MSEKLSTLAQICSVLTFFIVIGSLLVSYLGGANLEVIGVSQGSVKYGTVEIDLKIFNSGWQPAFVDNIIVQGNVGIISMEPVPPFIVYPHKDVEVKIKLSKSSNVKRYTNITFLILYKKNSILFPYGDYNKKFIIDWYR